MKLPCKLCKRNDRAQICIVIAQGPYINLCWECAKEDLEPLLLKVMSEADLKNELKE